MSRYVLTIQAQQDLKQIRDYILIQGGLRAARYVIRTIVTGFRGLARTPGQGHRREDLTQREELRFWSVFSYLIVYRIDKKPLTILAVLHGKRDVEKVLDERQDALQAELPLIPLYFQ